MFFKKEKYGTNKKNKNNQRKFKKKQIEGQEGYDESIIMKQDKQLKK